MSAEETFSTNTAMYSVSVSTPRGVSHSDPVGARRLLPSWDQAWLEGYHWALRHLSDPGVLADAHRLAREAEE